MPETEIYYSPEQSSFSTENLSADDFNSEEDTAAQLAYQQEMSQSAKDLDILYQEGQSYSHPSYLKYGVLFTLAGIIDLADLLDFTLVGIIVSKIVSFSLSAVIMLIFWLTNTKMKNAQNFKDGLGERIAHIQKNVARASRLAMKTSKILRSVGAKKMARAIPRSMVKLRRLAKKNPALKILIGGTINLIPWLGALNLMVIWIYLSYRDEKRVYKEAKETAEEAISEA